MISEEYWNTGLYQLYLSNSISVISEEYWKGISSLPFLLRQLYHQVISEEYWKPVLPPTVLYTVCDRGDFRGIIERGGELGLVLVIASSLVDFNGILKEVVPWPWLMPNQARSIDPRGALRERNTYKQPGWCCKRHPSGQSTTHTHGQPRPLCGVGLLVIELMVGLVYWVVSSHIGWLWFIVVSS